MEQDRPLGQPEDRSWGWESTQRGDFTQVPFPPSEGGTQAEDLVSGVLPGMPRPCRLRCVTPDTTG